MPITFSCANIKEKDIFNMRNDEKNIKRDMKLKHQNMRSDDLAVELHLIFQEKL